MAELRGGARGAGLGDQEVRRAAAVLEDRLHAGRIIRLAEQRGRNRGLRVENCRRTSHAEPPLWLVHIEAQIRAVALSEIAKVDAERCIHRPGLGLPVRERGIGRNAIAQAAVGAVRVRHREGVVARRCRAAFVDQTVAVVVFAVGADFRGCYAWSDATFVRLAIAIVVLVVAADLIGRDALCGTTFVNLPVAVVVDVVAALLRNTRIYVDVVVIAVALLGGGTAVAIAVTVGAVRRDTL